MPLKIEVLLFQHSYLYIDFLILTNGCRDVLCHGLHIEMITYNISPLFSRHLLFVRLSFSPNSVDSTWYPPLGLQRDLQRSHEILL